MRLATIIDTNRTRCSILTALFFWKRQTHRSFFVDCCCRRRRRRRRSTADAGAATHCGKIGLGVVSQSQNSGYKSVFVNGERRWPIIVVVTLLLSTHAMIKSSSAACYYKQNVDTPRASQRGPDAETGRCQRRDA